MFEFGVKHGVLW